MRSVDVKSIKLKAEAYQYQVVRFGNYRPQKPLSKAIARSNHLAKTLTVKQSQG